MSIKVGMHNVLLSENFPPSVGGSSRWFWEVYRRMPAASTLVLAGDQVAASAAELACEVPVARLPLTMGDWGLVSVAAMSSYWRACRAVQQSLQRRNIAPKKAVLHAGRCLPEGWIAWLLARRYNLRYVVYVHGEDVTAAATSRQHRFMVQRVLRGAAIVIANSCNTREILLRDWKLASNRVRVLYPGVDAERFRPATPDESFRAARGWQGRTVILTVGRLQQRKGHDHLIESLVQVKLQVPNVLYAIAGAGEERSRLEQLTAQHDLQGHVQFLGEVDDKLLVPCYQQCDLFALPNRAVGHDLEGFGMVLLEAQACGKAVLAGNSGGTRETLRNGETGRIAACDTPATLATALCELLGDRERLAEMGRAGREWIESRFDWPVRFQEAAEIFASIAGGDAPLTCVMKRHPAELAALAAGAKAG
jgi:phosphatidylinositol alpha-1,6-mannosyltransferase